MAPRARSLLAIAAAALCALGPARALAEPDDENDPNCPLVLSASNIAVSWNLNFNFQAVTITLSKAQRRACAYAIAFTRGSAPDYNRRMTSGANSLSYQLYRDSSLTQILKDLPDGDSATNTITGSFPKGENQAHTLTYYFKIPQDTATSPAIKASGSYSDTFTIKVYAANPGGNYGKVVETRGITVSTSIPKIIDISLVGPGAAFDESSTAYSINFGSLAQPQSQGFDLRVRTNAGYRIQFSSQNQGSLKHASPGASGSVPYTLKVDSAPQSLSGGAPVTVATGSGQTAPGGVARAVSISTGDAADNLAGQYTDYITVTASTTE